MDKRFQLSSTCPRFEITDPDAQALADGHSFQEQSFHTLENQPVPTTSVGVEDRDYDDDDREIMDRVLRNIDQILMEEGMDERQTRTLQESLDFQAKERSFYELLVGQNQCPDDNYHDTTSSGKNGYLFDVVDPSSHNTHTIYPTNNLTSAMDEQQTLMLPESLDFQAKERSFYELLVGQKHAPPSGDDKYHNSTSSGSGYLFDVVYPSSHNTHTIYPTNNLTSDVDGQINDNHGEIDQVVYNFQKGADDANKLLLIGSKMLGFDDNSNNEREARGKKNPPADLEDEEERSTRHPAVYAESDNVPVKDFDEVLLFTATELEKKLKALTLEPKGSTNNSKGPSNNSKGRRRRRLKKEVIDYRSLLICCAQSIAANDRRAADEFLRQIREHSSPLGDGEQRLAHYFADGLEARLAGTGSQMQKSLFFKRTTASDYLRAYHTYASSSPFVKIPHFVGDKMIRFQSVKENVVHIIDFGILYGFQWPIFIQDLAKREGGPPKLKITGIDFPQPGFRPTEIVEETGRRLARYAEKFNLPFEFNAIAQNWESIKIEDLKLEKGEFVTVNCLFRADSLSDEAGVGEESPRNMFLHLIRKIKPGCFIHGVVSASTGLPFFVSRFREVLFHYSSLYDMLETTMPRDIPERVMLESDIFGKEALNVIACENWERLGRTETYKQWQWHHLKAGFVQLPFERESMDSAVKKVRNLYHRNFLIDEDKDWLLLGWKGRILYAVSCWQAVSENARVR